MRAVTLVMYYHGALHNLCLWFFFKQGLCQEQRFVTVHCENAYFYTPSTQSCADACLISDMFSGLRVTKKKTKHHCRHYCLLWLCHDRITHFLVSNK